MNAVNLDLVAYGTVIPDLRTVVHDNPEGWGMASLSVDSISGLDGYLNGISDTPGDPRFLEGLRVLYESAPKDGALLSLLQDIASSGGGISVLLDPEAQSVFQTSGIIESYRGSLSDAAEIRFDTAATRGERSIRPSAIFVSRCMTAIERAFHRGAQAIHYQSADRLKRELELRGYVLEKEGA